MKTFFQNPATRYVLIGITALLLIAGGVHLWSTHNDSLAQGQVTNTSVSFSGESASTATVTVEHAGGAATASARTGDVPEAGDTVVMRQDGDQWVIPSHAALKATVLYPYSTGWPWLVASAIALSGAGLVAHAFRTQTARDDEPAQSE